MHSRLLKTKLKPDSLWLLRFCKERMDYTGGGGYAVHLAMPVNAPPVSMQTMRGLERRGLVEEFRTGMFRPTAFGLDYLKHVDAERQQLENEIFQDATDPDFAKGS